MDFLICRPDYYGIHYEINPWMHTDNQADGGASHIQWTALWEAIHKAGGNTVRISPQSGLPDMVFTANAGLILKDRRQVILSSFLHEQRKGEEEFFCRFFSDYGYTVDKLSHPFEGAGDALYLGDTLVCGYGFRTQLEAHHSLKRYDKLISVELVNNRFYHLDTCFCPLRGGYLIYPPAFSSDSLDKIRGLGFREVIVPDDEAERFACNAVIVKDTVILPEGCPTTVEELHSFGYNTISVPMTEFLKSGGACKCLTLRLD